MRSLLLLFLLSIEITVFAQNSFISGVVTVQNSEYRTGKIQYLSGVRVSDSLKRANSSRTNSKGQFLMEYINVPEKTLVQLDIFYNGYEVVNWHSLSATTGLSQSVKIAMARPESIAMFRAQLYNIDVPKILKPLKDSITAKRKQITQLLKTEKQNQNKIDKLQRQIYELAEKNQQLEKAAIAVAGVYERVNLDDQQKSFRISYEYFKSGNFDSCAAIIDRYNLYELFTQWENLKNLRLRKRHVEDSLSTLDLEALANMTELKSIRFQYTGLFDSAESNVKRLIKADTTRAQSWKLLGDLYSYKHADNDAGYAYSKAAMLVGKTDLYLLYGVLLNMGMVAIRQQDMHSGMTLVLMAQQLREKTAHVKKAEYDQDMARLYAAVAFSQLTQGNTDTLLSWLNKAYSLQMKIIDSANSSYKITASKISRDISIVYMRTKNFNSVARWLNESAYWLTKCQDQENPEWIDEYSTILFLKGTVAYEQKLYDSSMSFATQALTLINNLNQAQHQKFGPKWIMIKKLQAQIDMVQGNGFSASQDLKSYISETLMNVTGNKGSAFIILTELYDLLSEIEVGLKDLNSARHQFEKSVYYRFELAKTGEISHVKFLLDKYKQGVRFFQVNGPESKKEQYIRFQEIMESWALRHNYEANRIADIDIQELIQSLKENE